MQHNPGSIGFDILMLEDMTAGMACFIVLFAGGLGQPYPTAETTI